jgi:hypothetical protein
MLILAALRILMFRLISSANRGKRKGLQTSFLFVGVANWHHWGSGTRLGATRQVGV